jgi:hypothetical protein
MLAAGRIRQESTDMTKGDWLGKFSKAKSKFKEISHTMERQSTQENKRNLYNEELENIRGSRAKTHGLAVKQFH